MKKLSETQRKTAALELLATRDVGGGYATAAERVGQRAIEAAQARRLDAADDLCAVSDYFTARANPGAYCGGFCFPRQRAA